MDRKEYLVSIMKQLLESDEEIPDIVFETKEGYAADYVNPIFDNDKEGILAEFLKDNSMGNMAILSRSDNSAVSNSDYEDKKKIILDRINAGMFLPVATVNMFTGTYCKEGFSTDVWYPCHRQKYLQEMIIAAKEYLEG